MRRLLVGWVVAAVTVLVPIWAMAGNQEVAEQIAANLRRSGQLQDYKIGVKYQDGTAWLRGRVSSRGQMDMALRLVSRTPGVSRVVNNLTVGSDRAVEASVPVRSGTGPALTVNEPRTVSNPAASELQPLRQLDGAVTPERLPRFASYGMTTPLPRFETESRLGSPAVGHAERVATSFASTPARQVAATATQDPMLAEPQMPLGPAPPLPPQPVALQASRPIPIAYTVGGGAPMPLAQGGGQPIPQYAAPMGGGVAPVRYDQPHMPDYAWPSYAAYPNYAALTYPKQYSPTAWPYIGPFYPYPQVPLGWRKVTLEWHDGWWQLDFNDKPRHGLFSGLFRPCK